MENLSLRNLPSSFKWGIALFLLLLSLAFGVALLMSHDRYQLDHQKTVQYYLGDPEEGEARFPKPYSHLLQVTHVHSFVLPVVFFIVWGLLQGVPFLRSRTKKYLMVGGALSILIYNIAPYVLRFESEKAVWLFTIGGVGLFFFYFFPASMIFWELNQKNKK